MLFKRRRNREGQQGFALVILAGVLIVSSLAAASLLVSKDREQTWKPKLDARAQLKEVEQYLIRYQRENHRLPCPAAVDHAPDSINYGIEGANCGLGGAIAGIQRISSGGAVIRMGVLPVRTLGLPSKLASDAWGTRISYAVVEQLTDPFQFSDGPFPSIRVNNAAGTPLSSTAGFILISHGEKSEGGYSAKTGVQIGGSCGAAQGLDAQNCNADHIFVQADFNPTAGSGFYDDYVIHRAVDSMAQGMNTPCYPPRTATPYAWTGPNPASCSAPYPNMLHNTTQALTNSNPENTGSATIRCNNGVIENVTSTCEYTPSCPATTENWVGTVAGCSAARGNLAHGANTTLTNATGGRNGSVTVSCSYGVITQSGGSCNGNSCPLPWGGSLAHGGAVGAFGTNSVPCGSTCPSEVRNCSFGVLSGSYTHQSCSAVTCLNCTAPWGATVPHNSSTTAFAAAGVPCGSSCASETRSCWDGNLSGSYSNQSCSAAPCADCGLPWGGSIGHGGSVYAYNTYNAGCGGTCFGETRSCWNGSLSGSYGAWTCSAPCADCGLPWGGTIGHGGAVTAYSTSCVCGPASSSGDGGDGGYGAYLETPPKYALKNIPGSRRATKTTAMCPVNPTFEDLLTLTQGDGGDGGGYVWPSCASETRWCSNGSLSGSYGYSSCAPSSGCCGGSSSGDGGDGGY